MLDQPNGLALYGAYWRILEIIASQIPPGGTNCSVTYSLSRWANLLSVRGSHARHYLETLSNSKSDTILTAQWNDNDITMTCHNLLKYRDEYARKSGQTPDKLPTRTELELDTEQKQKQTTPKSAFVLPIWIPMIEWNAWLEVRKKKRASPTDHAMQLAVAKLDELAKKGFSPKEVLDEAILRNWTGIFEPNHHANGGSNGRKLTNYELIDQQILAEEEAERSQSGAAGKHPA